MSMFGLPDLMHQVGVDVGDLEYIEGKVIANNYFQESGDIDTLASTISFVVPSGKTAFMIAAKITPNTGGLNNKISAELKIDGVKKDEVSIFRAQAVFTENKGTANAGGAGWGYGMAENSGRFDVLGLSLVGDGIKTIVIENTLDGGGAFATMSGYLV